MPDLVAALRGLLPPAAGVGRADTRADHPLMPGETLPGATPGRLREFAAGRAAFRAALSDAGLPAMALPMAPDRSPVWPPGLALSISHDGACALAAVLPGARGLGIDLEPDMPLPPDLAALVLTASEQARGSVARVAFAAKEAAYKALFPTTRRVIGFDAMEIDIDGPNLCARLAADCPPFAAGHALRGGLAQAEGRILAAFVLPG
ncbi:MAG: 4'-phosphopantetheinyl transferase superfamily protein [Paracoccaceae bacterium]|nr:MAG: 4'-phosphopantetheinyl transferase superfamily protein [Paracoccaceae bacterium]